MMPMTSLQQRVICVAVIAAWALLAWTPAPARAESGVEQADVSGLSAVQDSASVRMLYRYCASCHRSDNPAPPNFLSGDVATVQSRLRQCAPRIFYRLATWAIGAEFRAVTPMPPMAALAAHGIDNYRWRESAELDTLRA